MRVTHRLALVVALIIVSGCGTNDRGDATSVLNRALSTEPESLDPHKSRTTQAADVQRDLGEGLLGYTPTGELTAGVAERWEVSDDGLTYTFYLRPDARWSNGDAVVAGDFVFALRRLVTPETAAFYAEFVGEIRNALKITSGEKEPETLGVRAIDDHTLEISLEQPMPYFLDLLTHPSTFPIHVASFSEHGDSFCSSRQTAVKRSVSFARLGTRLGRHAQTQ